MGREIKIENVQKNYRKYSHIITDIIISSLRKRNHEHGIDEILNEVQKSGRIKSLIKNDHLELYVGMALGELTIKGYIFKTHDGRGYCINGQYSK